MSAENKAIARRVIEEVWNKQDLDAVDDIYAPDVVIHGRPPDLPQGREGLKAYWGVFMRAFPDTHWTVEDQIAEGDKVVTRWTSTGTHTDELMGIPATGKEVSVTGIGIERIDGGQIVETWGEWDRLDMFQQLGVISSPGE